MARRSRGLKASRNSTPARRHAGCGQAASTSKDQLPGAVEAISCPCDRGIGSEQRVRLAGNGKVSSATDGCRIATTSGYYRSIYSTVAGDATRCSSSVEEWFLTGFHRCGRENSGHRGDIPFDGYWISARASRTERPLPDAGVDIRPRKFAGTQFQTAGHALSCRAAGMQSRRAPPRDGWSSGVRVIPNSPHAPRPRVMSIRNRSDLQQNAAAQNLILGVARGDISNQNLFSSVVEQRTERSLLDSEFHGRAGTLAMPRAVGILTP